MPRTTENSNGPARNGISVYWIPGCSSCVKVKEFVAEHGFEFESVNVLERPEVMDELESAGLRSVPAVRNGTRYAYAQSLDDVAALLDVANRHAKLPQNVLLARWGEILDAAGIIVAGFDEDMLRRRVIPQRDRTVRELSFHTFQVAESFLRQVEDDTIDARAIYLDPRPDLRTKDDVLSYNTAVLDEYRTTLLGSPPRVIPERLATHYGHQPSAQVLERGVWHSAQHARQLDFIAAGSGAELRIHDDLYAGLPMPRRLWA